MTPTQLLEVAKSGSLEDRRKLASSADTEPELLYFLTGDSAPEVRRDLVNNASTPHQAHQVLAEDEDVQVRGSLATKIAQLLPDLPADERDKVRKSTHKSLEILARDGAVMVRQILADALKDMADAPAPVIRRLAQDLEDVVSCPVLEFSPVLTDSDLLKIIKSSGGSNRLSAISRRECVSEDVCEAVIETRDREAVAQLLANDSAQIREDTLDMLVDEAPEIHEWHAPLVGRPALSDKAARRLAEYVADALLDELVARRDLDPATADAIRATVQERLAAQGDEGGTPATGSTPGSLSLLDEPPPAKATPSEAQALVDEWASKGQLTEGVIEDAIDRYDDEIIFAALAELTHIKVAVVRKAFRTKSAKGVLALVWRAGLTPRLAVNLQLKIARVKSSAVIRPKSQHEFGLTDEDMTWQLEFLQGLR